MNQIIKVKCPHCCSKADGYLHDDTYTTMDESELKVTRIICPHCDLVKDLDDKRDFILWYHVSIGKQNLFRAYSGKHLLSTINKNFINRTLLIQLVLLVLNFLFINKTSHMHSTLWTQYEKLPWEKFDTLQSDFLLVCIGLLLFLFGTVITNLFYMIRAAKAPNKDLLFKMLGLGSKLLILLISIIQFLWALSVSLAALMIGS